MFYSIQGKHGGTLLNLNYVGAVYIRESKGINAETDTFDVVAIPYNKINSLAIIQPHESNPKFEPIESFEVLVRHGISHNEAIAEMSAISLAMNRDVITG